MTKHDSHMADLHRQHGDGDKSAAIRAVFACVCSFPAKPVPRWARDAFARACYDVHQANVGSWDDVFGKPKGHLAARRHRLDSKEKVWREIQERRADGAAVDNELFEAVAADLKMGRRQVKELYDERRRAGWPLAERGTRFLGAPIVYPKR